MMGTSSAIFNPAVLFAWAILGRTAWEDWIILSLAQLAGAIAGVLCSYSQFCQQLNRVPIPRKDAQGNWLYMQVGYWDSIVLACMGGAPAAEGRGSSLHATCLAQGSGLQPCIYAVL